MALALLISVVGPHPSPYAQGRATQWTVIRSQHRRVTLTDDVLRFAVGDDTIASVEAVAGRELLVYGRDTGRTTLIVWFTSGAVSEYLLVVQQDLTLLRSALQRVHPSIDVEIAPDRDAVVLTGRVPDVSVSQQAEAVARTYLDVGVRNTMARPLVAAPVPAAPGQPPSVAGAAGATPGTAAGPATPGTPAGASPAATAADMARVQGVLPPSSAVINLIQLERLPLLPEDRIRDAVRWIGGEQVSVRRILAGNVRDDARDTLVLEGTVPNQVALVRTLQIAAQIFTNATLRDEDITVLSDEGGGLTSRTNQAATANTGNFGARAAAGLFGGGGTAGARLGNQVRANVARATMVSAANGRLLSFIRVEDLPQIRVNLRVFEVNREKLRNYTPVTAAIGTSLRLPSADTSTGARAAQGQGTSSATGTAVQNVLGFLAGGFLNEAQFTSNHLAVTQALTLLERDGVARTLSSPSLTVLAGESARFQVGGEVPIPIAFSPAIGGQTGSTPGVFTAVDFVSFGVQLEIRPLVGDDDTITVDVQPQVITPDAALTASIRDTTGQDQSTTAFATRALRTSARLPDGQSLILGGLSTRNATLNTATTPGLGDVPGLGWLFKGFNRSEDGLDLIVVVNPVILRPRLPRAPLWLNPTPAEVLRSIAGIPTAPAAPSPAAAIPR